MVTASAEIEDLEGFEAILEVEGYNIVPQSVHLQQ